ncbi:MAG: SDR family NAD(P)-dependent oxidoreductase, partial [Methylobacteriaceae bacterium]|nr:SDR family NAD(P)-dependent oxidoreductase [Methylobacteriaceae bacterium]
LRASDVEGRVVTSLSRRPSKGDPVAELLARCHVAGADIRGNPAFHGSQDLSGLPRYPWQRERFWLPPTQEDEYPVTERDEHPLLGVRRGGGDTDRWSRHIGVELQPWLADHQVGGAIVVPAAALIDMALAAAGARFPTAAALELIDLEIGRALVIEPGVLRELDFRIGAALDEFTLASRPRLEREPWTVHMSGRLAAREEAGTAVDWDLGEIGAKERILPGSRLYALAHDLGLDYGGAFRTVTQVEIASPQSAIVLFEEQVHLGDGYLIAPNLLDGALQGLLALAAGQLGSGTGVMPWRFGRIRLLDREACAPRSAQLRLTRVGPRSIRADVALIAADGRIVAELLECWFVRVALGGKTLGKDPFFRPVTVPSADGAALPLPSTAEILASIPAEGQSEAALLADAYASAAALEALRSAAPNGRINIDVMLGAGPTTPQGRALALVLLGWLQADGLAEQDESGSWAVGDELPPASAILQSLFFDTPTAGADVALLAAGAAALPEMILGGAAAALVAPALWEQLLYDSPSGTAAADRLIDAVERASVSLPIGRPLRILEIGARRGRLTQRLTDRLGERARIVAATDADDLPALTDALATRSTARAIAWEDAQDTGAFDLIIGLHALSFGDSGATIDAIRPLLAPNGIVLMAEPLPARAWSLMRADTAFRSGPQWQAALDAAGFQDAEARTLRTGLWPIGIIAARASTPLESEQPIPIEDLLLIGAGEHPLGERLRARLAATCATTIVAADALLPADSAARKIAILFDATHASLAEALAIIAQVAVMATDEVEREISLIVTAEASGDSYAAALTGARRVLVNEAANLRCRIIRLDRDLDRDEAATRAAAELAAPDGEDEISWSAAGRSVTRVRTGLPSLAAAAPDALRLSIERPGLLDSLAWQAATPAQPAANEIAIEIHATGLNFRDVMWAMGLLPDEALLDGYAGPTLGLECAGIVTAVGAEVAGFAQGDRVMAFAPASLGTHTVTAAHAALVIPEGMDFASAATVPVVFLTVAYALGQLAQLEAGETVLIHGGAGGVGLAAIQFAQARGARVFATAGSEPKRALLANLGVEAVLDSRSLSFADDVMRLTNGEGVDVVLNSLAGEAMRRSLALLKPFGRFLELGKRDFYENSAIGLRPLRHNISYFAVDADQLPVKRPALAARLLAEIGAMLREGALRPLPYRRFDLTAIEQAFRLMQGSGHIGKIVIERGATLPPTKLVPPPLSLPSDRTIVLTGGLDGFGKETARWLAAHGARHLALIGRRGPATPGANELLAELRFAAVDARPYTCDVADEASLARTLAAIRDEQAPIGGVVHAAVAMDDGLLMQLNAERFANALRPKLGGAELLDRLTRSDPVDLFILFSSVTTPLGNPGQANYVAANAAIEAIAEHRHAEGLPALAVQWGPIGDAGYLAREQGVSDLLARQLGGQHLSAREALDALPALLATGAPVAGFAPVRWSALRGRLPLLATTLFEEIGGAANDEGAEIDLRALIANASPEEAQAHVATMLIEEVARIMKLATDRIEPQRALAELGMDSLMAVELRLAVEQRFGISVPLLALSEGATVTAMAARIVRSMGGGEGLPPENVSTLVGRLARHERGTVEHDPADRLKRPAEHTFAAAAAAMP